MGVQKAELVAVQLVQLVNTRSAARDSTNQKARAPPPPGFPHTMLSVEKVNNNMRLAFIEKLFTNREIRTNV